MRYSIINTTTNLVENVVEYLTAPSNPPPGYGSNYIAVADNTSAVGWSYNGGVFTNPNPPGPPSALSVFILQVQIALDASDSTMNQRIPEAVALGLNTWNSSDVVAWVNYRRALRTLLKSSTVQTIPTKPAYPAGT